MTTYLWSGVHHGWVGETWLLTQVVCRRCTCRARCSRWRHCITAAQRQKPTTVNQANIFITTVVGWIQNFTKLEVGHSTECITHTGHSIAFLYFWPRDLDLWPFDVILTGGQGIMMDYLCAKFGDFSFSRFGFIVRTDRQNHRGRSTINAILTQLPSAE